MKSTPFLLLGLALVAFSGNATAAERKFSKAKIQTFTKLFNEADLDSSGDLNFEEFSNSYGASPRPVITQIRFDELASDINTNTARGLVIIPSERGILLDDFIAANGGRSIKPSQEDIFWAADDDASGGLDFDEFADTRVYPASTSGSIFQSFDRIDKDDDGIISPAEWGIKVKG
jgi:Ca2+-binding EF-hand superfamily protein